jgi:hypothetical protein
MMEYMLFFGSALDGYCIQRVKSESKTIVFVNYSDMVMQRRWPIIDMVMKHLVRRC